MRFDIIELASRVLCDTKPLAMVDGAYIFCSTADNQKSVLMTATEIIEKKIAKNLLIFGSEAMSGYPGGHIWRDQLMALGMENSIIIDIPVAKTTSINTLIEANALIKYKKAYDLKSLIVISTPFHQLRAFMTTVTVALKIYPNLLIYSYPSVALNWVETVTHSQGVLRTTRNKLIHEEIIRIRRYQGKNDLASFEDVLGYLNHRDTRVWL